MEFLLHGDCKAQSVSMPTYSHFSVCASQLPSRSRPPACVSVLPRSGCCRYSYKPTSNNGS